MSRVEFRKPVQRIIASRSGFRCSFPNCGRSTIGPAINENEFSNIGVASHIYAASPNGPRGNGGLSKEEIGSPNNGIWLCQTHSKMIDNNNGVDYPAQLLLSYKTLHEQRILREMNGLPITLGWVEEITVKRSPIFQGNVSLNLGKMNILVGENGSGKSALLEWISGFNETRYLERWLKGSEKGTAISFGMKYYDPLPHSVNMEITKDQRIKYEYDGKDSILNPSFIKVVYLEEYRIKPGNDDLETFSTIFNISPELVFNVLVEMNNFRYRKVSDLRFENVDAQYLLKCSVDGTVPNMHFRNLSGREQQRVFIEFACAIARYYSNYSPTILVLDHIAIYFEEWFEYYKDHFFNSESAFQTIVSIPIQNQNFDKIKWLGWSIVRLNGRAPNTRISNNIR